ncbi:atrophin-1 family protein [Leptothoe spongobia]|uniref:Uncharacterized protein n=1 Tax=Leptothoe spongobia TAU-MAC 1115 TaxID=1967444 RepID=A0A947DCG6_9CYAN|nr:hypothetical protein [Leptothoe spongobia]MBT9314600.1 hypothetical protein [Leptothoe spongobia TAU-MAC 1115]
MIKPSDKVLIGWITLFTAFASTNLGQVSASELSTTATPEPSANDSATDLASTEQSDAVAAGNAAVAINAESIAPENEVQQPEFSPQAIAEVASEVPVSQETSTTPVSLASPPLESPVVPPNDSNDTTAKLEHLVATATKPLPGASVPQADPVSPDQATKFDHLDPLVTKAAQPLTVAPVQTNNGTDQLEQSEPVLEISPPPQAPTQSDSSATKLEHLVATATREIPTHSSLLDRTEQSAAASQTATPSISSESTVTASHPSASPEVNIPTGALPTARVISPDSAVVEPLAMADEIVSPAPVAVDEISSDTGGSEVIATTTARRPLPVLTEMPTGALPTTRVMLPDPPQAAVENELRDHGSPEVGLPHSGDSRADAASIQALKARVSQALAAADTVTPNGAVPGSLAMTPNTASVEITVSGFDSEASETETVVDTAQLPLEPPLQNLDAPSQAEVDELLRELEQPGATVSRPYQSSPAITISNPSGFGADNYTAFVGVGYQERTRFGNEDDGGAVIGIGLGDARENVGVQLSYTVASFGGSRDFGAGGFNAKVHKRLTESWSVALGWEGFITTDSPVDFKDSIYGSVSHLIRTRESITEPFSRVAVTAGVGNGRFRTEDDVFDNRDNVNVFGSVAVRVVEPVSAIVEWTGQDLAAGVSITPFRDLPLVLLPAIRDITGAGDGSRFVLGAGVSFQL